MSLRELTDVVLFFLSKRKMTKEIQTKQKTLFFRWMTRNNNWGMMKLWRFDVSLYIARENWTAIDERENNRDGMTEHFSFLWSLGRWRVNQPEGEFWMWAPSAWKLHAGVVVAFQNNSVGSVHRCNYEDVTVVLISVDLIEVLHIVKEMARKGAHRMCASVRDNVWPL